MNSKRDKPLPDMIRELANGMVDTAKGIFSQEGDLRPVFFLIDENKQVTVVDVGAMMGDEKNKNELVGMLESMSKDKDLVAIINISESWVFDDISLMKALGLTEENLLVDRKEYLDICRTVTMNMYHLYNMLYGSIAKAPFANEAITVTLDSIWGTWLRRITISRDAEGKGTLRDNPWEGLEALGGRFANILKKTPTVGPDGPEEQEPT